MRKFLRHCLTGRDNRTFDIARVLWALGAAVFIGCALWSVVRGGAFDAQAYGTGFGLLMGGAGGSVWAKAKTEPGAHDDA